jgi:hypothetical protein
LAKIFLFCNVQATFGALGTLSDDPHEYSIRPCVISGLCKKETGAQHAHFIRTVMQAVTNQSLVHRVKYRTVSITSDGESKRGDALVELTMRWELNPSSPIYLQLKPLNLMNLLVGEDDVTADKDFKHVFKRQRNLLLRNKGFVIRGFCVTTSILRLHLQSNNVSSDRLRSLLNPNDRQDVVLGYNLMKEIWSLPPAKPTASPDFARAREALRLYGQFAYHLIMPYICVDLNLDEQLSHLSTAAHLAFYLYTDGSAKTKFMPNQSFVNIMIMVKNGYFCVAKCKVDNPKGSLRLFQLGTDALEGFFGLIRTAIGTDTNVDIMQLGSRASGLVEVAAILALHPEWDQSPRRLGLPMITKDTTTEINSKFDHINPASWRGSASVESVNLHTAWILGERAAIKLIPEAEQVFDDAVQRKLNMLSPFGILLVNQRDEEDDFDFSELSAQYLSNANTCQQEPAVSHRTHTLDGDIEDMIAEDLPRGSISSEIQISGRKTTKPQALRQRMMHRTNRSSTDRLKRV